MLGLRLLRMRTWLCNWPQNLLVLITWRDVKTRLPAVSGDLELNEWQRGTIIHLMEV